MVWQIIVNFAVVVNFVIFGTFDGPSLQPSECISLILYVVLQIIINFRVFVIYAILVTLDRASLQPFE